MAVKYRVKKGDCISSIAAKYGHFPETIWDDPDNADLKIDREKPDILYEGDIVIVREKEEKQEGVATDNKYKFRRKGIPKMMEVQFLLLGEPRANQSYRLDLDGSLSDGSTDGNGWVKQAISPGARDALFIFDDGGKYELQLGHMDPVNITSGVQARLNNLRLYYGPIDGKNSPTLDLAIKSFQEQEGLDTSGQMDPATEDALAAASGE
jgi:hypothetical protein